MVGLTKVILRLAAGVAVAVAGAGAVSAAESNYPDRAVTWIVPFAVGGPTDAVARTVAQRVATELGQSIIVDNVPGAGGTLGATRAARAKADGYTLFVGHIGTMAAAPYLFNSLNYDPLRDFVPVFRFPDTPMALLVRSDSPFQNATELFEAARKNPEKLTFGTAGVGSSSHLAAEHLAATIKAKFTFVPYKGTGPAMTDLMGGQIDVMLDQTNVALPQVQGGRLKALALTSQSRMPLFPGVPTLTENELPGFLASTWYGIYAPAGTPSVVIDVLRQAYLKALADKSFTDGLRNNGIDVLAADQVQPGPFGDFTRSEQAKWQRVIRDAGITAQ